jgi:medium-chain acyl-[acyl-carrier-protein] hydrolase
LYEFRPPTGTCALVCLPYAGGSASIFDTWQRQTSVLDIVAVQLPGRANRIAEPPLVSLAEMVDRLTTELAGLGRDYALFGHSMGALVAFELARRIRDDGLDGPRALFVSAYPAPDLPIPPPVYNLPRPELIRWLVDNGGLDIDVAQHDELMDVLLPALRADLAVADTYAYRSAPSLPWPIRVFLGAEDPSCTLADVGGWHRQSTRGCEVDVLPGDHFYLHDQAALLVELIERDLVTRGGIRA